MELGTVEKASDLSPIHTVCKDCVFADYKDGTITQSGCKLGRIEKFGDKVVEAEDHDKEFYIINGRVCNAFRHITSSWAGTHKDDAAQQVKKELELKLTMLVHIDDGLIETLTSIKNQTLKPHLVVFINNQDKISRADLNATLWDNLGNIVTWRIFRPINSRETSYSKDEVTDLAVGNVKTNLYTLVQSGQVLPETFVSDIDKAINEDLMQFLVLKPNKDGIGLTIHNAAQAQHCGVFIVKHEDGKVEQFTDMADKIGVICRTEGCEHLVKEVGDICSNLK